MLQLANCGICGTGCVSFVVVVFFFPDFFLNKHRCLGFHALVFGLAKVFSQSSNGVCSISGKMKMFQTHLWDS